MAVNLEALIIARAQFGCEFGTDFCCSWPAMVFKPGDHGFNSRAQHGIVLSGLQGIATCDIGGFEFSGTQEYGWGYVSSCIGARLFPPPDFFVVPSDRRARKNIALERSR